MFKDHVRYLICLETQIRHPSLRQLSYFKSGKLGILITFRYFERLLSLFESCQRIVSNWPVCLNRWPLYIFTLKSVVNNLLCKWLIETTSTSRHCQMNIATQDIRQVQKNIVWQIILELIIYWIKIAV